MSETTAIDICNSALVMLGAGTIASFDDDTDEARACRLLYGPVRRGMLETYPWDFATLQVNLGPPLATLPLDTRYAFAYALPAGWGWVRSVRFSDDRRVDPWKIFGNKVYAGNVGEADELIAEITFDMAEEDLPGFFKWALIKQMAAELAGPLTEDGKRIETFGNQAEIVWARCRRQSSQMKTPARVTMGRFAGLYRG